MCIYIGVRLQREEVLEAYRRRHPRVARRPAKRHERLYIMCVYIYIYISIIIVYTYIHMYNTYIYIYT